MTFPVSDALEKATGKTGQELASLLASHLMHIGRAGNHGHQLPPLLGPNRKPVSRTCAQCQQAADLVKLIEQALLEPAQVAVETQEK